MTVCKFFLNNSCRFGSNCRNSHTYEEPKYAPTQRKTSGVSVLQRNRYSTVHTSREEPDLNFHLLEISRELNINGYIWPASTYSYLTDCGNVPGFEDISPEELRLKAYDAKNNNNLQAYITEFNNLQRNVAESRSKFVNKTHHAAETLSSYLKDGQLRNKQFSQPGANKFSSSEFFTSGIQSTSSSTEFFSSSIASPGFVTPAPHNTGSFSLSNNPAFRGQTQCSAFSTNIFAQALNENTNNSPSPFTQNNFASGVFGQDTSAFGEPMQESVPFKENFFGTPFDNPIHVKAAQASQSSSQVSSSNYNQNYSQAVNNEKSKLYSSEADLITEELDQFKATTFIFGKTPLKCPPHSYC